MWVYATPGTQIYSPDSLSTPIATVTNSGRTEIIASSDVYYGYLLAKYPGQDIRIPFGLDTKHKSTTGEGVAMGLGITMAIAGIGAMTAGVITMCTDSENSSIGTLYGCGGGAALVGAGIVASEQSRLEQLSHKYQYTYQKNQNALEMGTAPLISRDPKKGETATATQQGSQRKKAVSSASQSDGKNNTILGSAAKTRSDYAKNIQGTYVGTGSLLKLSTIEERYSNVKIILERIDKSHVKVTFYEADEEYFESPDTYEIKYNSDGSYSLIIPTISSATITIDKKGNLTYLHKKVIIDGDTYTLKASVVKKKQ
jgi:hypothetical protein